jgi:hypothetical protein
MRPDFNEKLESFLAACKQKQVDNWAFPHNPDPLTLQRGRKYVKLLRDRSVIAFIDIETGDIFRSASRKQPTKGVRGNIFSADNGLEATHTAFGFLTIG